MKKHPIDELFAKKLAEHRQEPSQKAFEKFQTRLQEKQTKRRGGVFAFNRNWAYYAAAAGVVAVLTIGVLSQNNTADTQVGVNNSRNNAVETVKQALAPVVANNTPLTAGTEAKTESANEVLLNTTKGLEVAATENSATVKVPVVEENPSIHFQEPEKAVAHNQVKEVQPLQVAALAGKNTALADGKTESTSVASKYNIGESVTLIVAPVEENTLASVTETESVSSEEKVEKEKSFLGKLYGEYKHFKYGEKVDLKKIGVKDAMARVDESLLKEEREDVRDFVQRRIGRMQKRE